MHKQVKVLPWNSAEKSQTTYPPLRRPRLKPDFVMSLDVFHKRKVHILRIFGKGVNLICARMNQRAKRKLAKSSSESYKNRWKDLRVGPTF